MNKTVKTSDNVVIDVEFLNRLINLFNQLGREQGILNIKREELDKQLDCFLNDMWIQTAKAEENESN